MLLYFVIESYCNAKLLTSKLSNDIICDSLKKIFEMRTFCNECDTLSVYFNSTCDFKWPYFELKLIKKQNILDMSARKLNSLTRT